ncbi:hypothetical protein DRH14_02010 [Candidatus Shapirobacteria bacterium]|nr:MAG: hypothetical protein DRH14_02010 [Candidatus Shapirobacteria bacterium]
MLSSDTRDNIIEEARKYLGTPFLHQGRSASGLDCVGLIMVVAEKLEVVDITENSANSIYNREPNPIILRNIFREYGERVDYEHMQSGDVMLLRNPMYPCHVAFYIKPNRMIHCISTPGLNKVVEHNIHDIWRRRVIECYSFKGLN